MIEGGVWEGLDMNFFMADGNVQKGPFPIDQLISQGLKRDTLVWREGMGQWQKAETVPELAVLFTGYQQQQSAAPPPPPPMGGGFPQQPPAMQYPSAPRFDAASANSQKIAAGICGTYGRSIRRACRRFIIGNRFVRSFRRKVAGPAGRSRPLWDR